MGPVLDPGLSATARFYDGSLGVWPANLTWAWQRLGHPMSDDIETLAWPKFMSGPC